MFDSLCLPVCVCVLVEGVTASVCSVNGTCLPAACTEYQSIPESCRQSLID